LVTTLHTTYQSETVATPNPAGGSAVTPLMIESMWGPLTNVATYCGMLNLEYKVKGDLLNGIMVGIKTASQTVDS